MAANSDRLLCAACFRFDYCVHVVEGAWQFYFYGLRRPEPGSNRRAMARVSQGRKQLLFVFRGDYARRAGASGGNAWLFFLSMWGLLSAIASRSPVSFFVCVFG